MGGFVGIATSPRSKTHIIQTSIPLTYYRNNIIYGLVTIANLGPYDNNSYFASTHMTTTLTTKPNLGPTPLVLDVISLTQAAIHKL